MKFIFETDPPTPNQIVNWRAFENKKDLADGNSLCCGSSYIGENHLRCVLDDPDRYGVSTQHFADKESAATAVYEVREALKKCAVPLETQAMVQRLMEDIHQQSRDLQGVQITLHCQMRLLFYHAKEIGVQVHFDEDDVNATAAFKKLLQWAPEWGLPAEGLRVAGKKSGWAFDEEDLKIKHLPFLSQSVIYPLLGKEQARTFYALLKHAITLAGIQWDEVE